VISTVQWHPSAHTAGSHAWPQHTAQEACVAQHTVQEACMDQHRASSHAPPQHTAQEFLHGPSTPCRKPCMAPAYSAGGLHSPSTQCRRLAMPSTHCREPCMAPAHCAGHALAQHTVQEACMAQHKVQALHLLKLFGTAQCKKHMWPSTPCRKDMYGPAHSASPALAELVWPSTLCRKLVRLSTPCRNHS
jgi:hypothetical protein